ncbi:hypothetical protein ACFLZ9_02155 [Patescibacteria group bacterium]
MRIVKEDEDLMAELGVDPVFGLGDANRAMEHVFGEDWYPAYLLCDFTDFLLVTKLLWWMAHEGSEAISFPGEYEFLLYVEKIIYEGGGLTVY